MADEIVVSHDDVDGFQETSGTENAMENFEDPRLNFNKFQGRQRFILAPPPSKWSPEFNAYVLSLYGKNPMFYEPIQSHAPTMHQGMAPLGYGYQHGNYYIPPPPYGAPPHGSWYYGHPFSAFGPLQHGNYLGYQDGVPHYPPHFGGAESPFYDPRMNYPSPPGTVSDESEEIFALNSGRLSPNWAEQPQLSPRSSYRAGLNAEAPEFVPRFSEPQHPSVVANERHQNLAPSRPADTERKPALDRYRLGAGRTNPGSSSGRNDNQSKNEDDSRQHSNKKTQKMNEGPTCGFCYQKGDRNYNHILKDSKGEVLCPSLRSIRCFLCGATGGSAHTSRHCPKNTCKKGKPTSSGAKGTTSASATTQEVTPSEEL